MKGSRTLGKLPTRFQWTVHNIVAHPVSEILWQVGLVRLSEWAHDRTIPQNVGPPRGGNEAAAGGPGENG